MAQGQGPESGPRKGFKFQTWMLGLAIIPVALFFIVTNIMQKGTVEIGGSCGANDDCKDGNAQCIEVDGRSMCTTQCVVGSPAMACAAGTSCQNVAMSVGGNSVPMAWCLPGT